MLYCIKYMGTDNSASPPSNNSPGILRQRPTSLKIVGSLLLLSAASTIINIPRYIRIRENMNTTRAIINPLDLAGHDRIASVYFTTFAVSLIISLYFGVLMSFSKNRSLIDISLRILRVIIMILPIAFLIQSGGAASAVVGFMVIPSIMGGYVIFAAIILIIIVKLRRDIARWLPS